MKDRFAQIMISLCLAAFIQRPSFTDPGDSIRKALKLNKSKKYLAGLSILQKENIKAEFKDLKLRYFLAKQYILCMEKSILLDKTTWINTRSHLRHIRKAIKTHSAQNQNFFRVGFNDLLIRLKSLNTFAENLNLKTIKNSNVTRVKKNKSTPPTKVKKTEKAISKSIHKSPAVKSKTILTYPSLLKAAQSSLRKYKNIHGACCKVANYTANLNGAEGNRWMWPTEQTFRWREIDALHRAIKLKYLKPGMVIYANTSPGADPVSTNMKFKPHWFTYLGKDPQGIDRFSDQYKTNYTVETMKIFIKKRKIDCFFDPYQNLR
jgi:hypothetical protein